MLVSTSVQISDMAPGETYVLDGAWLAVDPAILPPSPGKKGFVRLTDGYYRESDLTQTVQKVALKAVPV